jgi:hypothetical protein
MNAELRMWKELLVALFKVPLSLFNGGTEENHNSGTCRTHSRSVLISTLKCSILDYLTMMFQSQKIHTVE